jgi:hypothetical protein
MAMPSIVVNGKKIIMPKPKIKLWREMIKFNERREAGEFEGLDLFDATLDLVVLAFNDKAVTREVIEETMSIDELTECFESISREVRALVLAKAAKFPNVQIPTKP